MNADIFEMILQKYGQSATYYSGDAGPLDLKAFIQPIIYKNRQYLGDSYTPVGQQDAGRYMYFGSGSAPLSEDGRSFLESGGLRYDICRSELIFFGDGVHHVRAILKLRGEDADYGD